MNHTKTSSKKELEFPDSLPRHNPLPGQTDFPFVQDANGVQAGSDVESNGQPGSNGQPIALVMAKANPKAKAKPETKAAKPEDDLGAGDKPPTGRLLAAARRVRDFKRESRGRSRQLDISLRATPDSEVYFRVWPNPMDEFDVAIIRPKTGAGDRKELYVLSPEVAELPHVIPHVREGKLVPCITSTGRLYVWAKSIPDPDEPMVYRMHDALERAGKAARERWVMITWRQGTPWLEEPCEPIEEKPAWPDGQLLQEIYEIAIRGAFIDNLEHPVIRGLKRIAKEL